MVGACQNHARNRLKRLPMAKSGGCGGRQRGIIMVMVMDYNPRGKYPRVYTDI